MQRFFMFHSFDRFHRNSIASASLFLAAKVEEQPRKLERMIKVAHMCLHLGKAQLEICHGVSTIELLGSYVPVFEVVPPLFGPKIGRPRKNVLNFYLTCIYFIFSEHNYVSTQRLCTCNASLCSTHSTVFTGIPSLRPHYFWPQKWRNSLENWNT